jgi:multidrug efflux system membrane fusion protein
MPTRHSAKGADARRQTRKEFVISSGGVLDMAAVLRGFLRRSNALQFIGVLAAMGLMGGCHPESPLPSRSPTSVRLAAVTTSQTSGEALRYSASIIPYAQVDLVFRTSGYVTGVKQVRGADGRIRDIGTGDYVEKGTVLAHVRLEDLKNQVAQAQAQLGQAVAQQTQADQDFARAKVLFSTQSLTKPDYDQSQQRFNSTLAAVDNAKAALRQVELTLGDSDLKAPFSGFVLNRYIELGSLASPSSAAFSIADISSVKATFGVPDYALSRVRLGQQLSIALEDDVTPIVGHVTSIAPSADTRNRVFAIEVTVANHRGRLKPGMIASVSLGESSHSSAPSVPLSAIVPYPSEAGRFAVMVAQERAGKWTASLREVQLGATHESSIAVVGVQPGEKVVAVGAQLLKDGEPIEVIP